MAAVTINLAGINGIGFGIGTANGADKGDGKDGQLKNGSIFAGNINGGMSSLIEQKRAQARKQATKMLHDQFARDNEVSDNIKKLYARNETIGEELAVLAEQKNRKLCKRNMELTRRARNRKTWSCCVRRIIT